MNIERRSLSLSHTHTHTGGDRASEDTPKPNLAEWSADSLSGIAAALFCLEKGNRFRQSCLQVGPAGLRDLLFGSEQRPRGEAHDDRQFRGGGGCLFGLFWFGLSQQLCVDHDDLSPQGETT